MALARKNSRPIVVDELSLRHAISQSASQDPGVFAINLTVQDDGGKGRLLKVEGLRSRDFWLDVPDTGAADDYLVLKPHHIATIVALARAGGWEPAQPGAPFVLQMSAEQLATLSNPRHAARSEA